MISNLRYSEKYKGKTWINMHPSHSNLDADQVRINSEFLIRTRLERGFRYCERIAVIFAWWWTIRPCPYACASTSSVYNKIFVARTFLRIGKPKPPVAGWFVGNLSVRFDEQNGMRTVEREVWQRGARKFTIISTRVHTDARAAARMAADIPNYPCSKIPFE